MIQTDKLKGLIAEKGLTQKDVAEQIGISPKTFYEKMQKKAFGTDEAEVMIKMLDIKNPVEIFFNEIVTLQDTKCERG